MSKVCVIVPHGDDETLGFAGTIQHHTKQGDEVTIIVCRAPHDERTQQQLIDAKKAINILGVKNIVYLYITEIEISHSPLLLFRSLEEKLLQLNPDIVYTTFWGDNHQDHRILFDCVSRAVRVYGPLQVKKLFVGEIPSSTDQAPRLSFNQFLPNVYVPITEEELKIKLQALGCYTTELRESPHPRSSEGITSLARMRGMECGSMYAEALILVREIK